jgi:hypothetical protein
MINPFKEVNWNPGSKEKRQFARSLVVGFPVLALVWLLIGRWSSGSWPLQPTLWLGGIGAALGAVLWAMPAIAKPFYLLWYGIACSIGLVVSNVLLITFYLTVVTTFGTLRRAFGRQTLQKEFNKIAATYWRDAERISDPKRYYSQF